MWRPVSRIATLLRNSGLSYNTLASFSSLVRPPVIFNSEIARKTFLNPTVFNIVPSCGFKVKGKLRKRCKGCYFVRREERLFVICEKHPRHKQMSMIKDPKNTWILTHATQGKVRPW